MSTESITTVARPYAKAIFEIALNDNNLESWSSMLHLMASIALDSDVISLVETPGIETESISKFFIDVCGKHIDDAGKNVLIMLTENNRLMALPEICAIYEKFKAEQERTLDVTVRAFNKLDKAQEESIVKSLKKRLSREINLNVTIDESLLGGAIIHAGSLVIDGSVKTKLDNLSIGLQEA